MRNVLISFMGNVLVCLLLIFAVASVPAAEAGQASGQFDSKGIHLKIADAYAFRGTPYLGGKEKVIVVVVSNLGFVHSAIDEYWDRRNALNRYFKDERTGLVFFEFGLDGRYRGLSYYFGPGNGCGYCSDSAVHSTVRLASGRLTGKLNFPKGTDPNRWFDVSLDVPISSDDYGIPQGAGGGEPGKAYIAYHRALCGKDEKAIKALLSEEHRSMWAKAEAKRNGASFLASLCEEHPNEVRVTAAYIKGGRALILLEGKGSMGSVRGEALLSHQRGEWRFEEETFQTVSK
jgi:hypothetical protein